MKALANNFGVAEIEFRDWQEKGLVCICLKKVDSQQRVNNGVFTHPETAQLL